MQTVKASRLVNLLECDPSYTSECDCTPYITSYGIEWSGNECWFVREVASGPYRAEYSQTDGLSIYHNTEKVKIEEDVVEMDLTHDLIDLLRFPDTKEHPQHSDEIRAVRITQEIDDQGYYAWVDPMRGFANEYTVYLAQNRDCNLPEDAEEITTIDAGKRIAATGDDGTQMHNSLVVID